MKVDAKAQNKKVSFLKQFTSPITGPTKRFIKSHPFITLFSLLGLLVGLIVISNFIQRPKIAEEQVTPQTKNVRVYRIGEAPKITVQAQVEKSGVVTIAALSPGVVSEIPVAPGDVVEQGTVLVSTSSNYEGGNTADLQVSINARTLQNINETYQIEKDLIKKQKEKAERVDEDSDEMREISRQSIAETEAIIALNNEILSTIDAAIAHFTTTNETDEIATQKGLKLQALMTNNQLQTTLRNTQYSSSDDHPPAEISNLDEEITKKQLEIQDKALDLNRDIARLNLAVSQVQAAAMRPSAPFSGTIQRIFVKVGQAIQPGTPLAVISQTIEEDPIVAVAYVPADTARKTSYLEPSKLTIGTFTYEAYPSYITQDAVQGTLHAIYFPIPDTYSGFVTDTGYISVQIPIGAFDTNAIVPYVPIDSVYQTQTDAYLFVINKGKAESKKVILGNVIGRFVEVTQGLNSGDAIILDRNVISGDPVKVN